MYSTNNTGYSYIKVSIYKKKLERVMLLALFACVIIKEQYIYIFLGDIAILKEFVFFLCCRQSSSILVSTSHPGAKSLIKITK